MQILDFEVRISRMTTRLRQVLGIVLHHRILKIFGGELCG